MKQLIHGGRLLTAGRLDGEHADILIDGDTIVAVLAPGESVGDDVGRIDATNRLLIPGLINAHTHATVHLAKAMADRWSLELLLNAYPWTAGGRTLEYKYLSAYIGAVEMVRKGCTACYDLVGRDSGAVARGHRRGRPRLCRRRHARGDRADDGGPHASTRRSPACSTPCRRRCASAPRRSAPPATT